MQFTLATAAAIFGATALAQTTENIDIRDFSLWKSEDGTPLSASFKLSGDDATDLSCSVDPIPQIPTDVITCGETKYRFALENGSESEFGLRIYHELGLAVGRYGEGDIATYCHAGGASRLICNQVNENTIVISS